MNITDDQAINYISGCVLTIKNKIKIIDSQSDEIREKEDLFISSDERFLCASLEIVLNKAKSNILINPDVKNGDAE